MGPYRDGSTWADRLRAVSRRAREVRLAQVKEAWYTEGRKRAEEAASRGYGYAVFGLIGEHLFENYEEKELIKALAKADGLIVEERDSIRGFRVYWDT